MLYIFSSVKGVKMVISKENLESNRNKLDGVRSYLYEMYDRIQKTLAKKSVPFREEMKETCYEMINLINKIDDIVFVISLFDEMIDELKDKNSKYTSTF